MPYGIWPNSQLNLGTRPTICFHGKWAEDESILGGFMFNSEMSHEGNPSYFPLYWLVNRDPYNGLLESLNNWVDTG